MMWGVTIPLRVVSTLNTREHWAERARRAKSHRHTTSLIVNARMPRELRGDLHAGESLTVELVRIAPRQLDGDNLQGALKSIRDGVADALHVDDGDPRVTWRYGQQQSKGGKYGVEIRIGGTEP